MSVLQIRRYSSNVLVRMFQVVLYLDISSVEGWLAKPASAALSFVRPPPLVPSKRTNILQSEGSGSDRDPFGRVQ